jgi:hypothetical protein
MAVHRLFNFAIAAVSIAVLAGTAAVLSGPSDAATSLSVASPVRMPPDTRSTGDSSLPSAAAVLRPGAPQDEDAPTF